MNCSALQEQAAGSLPSASQVSLPYHARAYGIVTACIAAGEMTEHAIVMRAFLYEAPKENKACVIDRWFTMVQARVLCGLTQCVLAQEVYGRARRSIAAKWRVVHDVTSAKL